MVYLSNIEARNMILGIGDHNIFKTLQFARDNKEEIYAYIQNKSYEGYDDTVDWNWGQGQSNIDKENLKEAGDIAGTTIAFIILVIITSIGLWIWALVVTIKYFDVLPAWAKVLSVLGLIGPVGGPILTLIAVYAGKGK